MIKEIIIDESIKDEEVRIEWSNNKTAACRGPYPIHAYLKASLGHDRISKTCFTIYVNSDSFDVINEALLARYNK